MRIHDKNTNIWITLAEYPSLLKFKDIQQFIIYSEGLQLNDFGQVVINEGTEQEIGFKFIKYCKN